MTQISVAAFVPPGEQATVARAAQILQAGLADEGAKLACATVADFDGLRTAAGTIRIASLTPELGLERLDTPWSEVEQRLRQDYAALCDSGDPVLITTIFRHIGAQRDPDRAEAILVRLRRLNLLATELSRAYGLFVIDLDRIFSDVGAVRVMTDYGMDGHDAAELAGHALALGIVDNALDAALPFEAQERVKRAITASRPAIQPPPDLVPGNLMTMGKGRRRQVVSTITDSVQDNHVGWLIRQVLKGQIPPRQAADKLIHAVRRRGVQESLGLLTSGMVRLMGLKPQ
ncbi:SGNH/GDSL hydrolase family protein [Gluconacetobacter azotocaptans]|uniref:SGNH/GDSL hydrolase family protein n=1 Tax=Gluconacetobacter azotocaptans TaxID=142834 RepID=UPI00195D5E17|nr:SGNH/GDSL hydrolase family protein [Gluconacetobacter azotocaptans]MBM9400292.1 SGNH/GDSL hydrolase family protein [Gluconacetobacter azotocaptans]